MKKQKWQSTVLTPVITLALVAAIMARSGTNTTPTSYGTGQPIAIKVAYEDGLPQLPGATTPLTPTAAYIALLEATVDLASFPLAAALKYLEITTPTFESGGSASE